jgi:anti-sigma B factor antagonist
MSLRCFSRTEGDVAILELEGNITLGDGSGVLRDAVKAQLADGSRKILLDLQGVNYIDSAGLGELVGCFATAENKNAVLKLLNLQRKVHGLLQITKLITVFEVYEDEDAALRSFVNSGVANA